MRGGAPAVGVVEYAMLGPTPRAYRDRRGCGHADDLVHHRPSRKHSVCPRRPYRPAADAGREFRAWRPSPATGTAGYTDIAPRGRHAHQPRSLCRGFRSTARSCGWAGWRLAPTARVRKFPLSLGGSTQSQVPGPSRSTRSAQVTDRPTALRRRTVSCRRRCPATGNWSASIPAAARAYRFAEAWRGSDRHRGRLRPVGGRFLQFRANRIGRWRDAESFPSPRWPRRMAVSAGCAVPPPWRSGSDCCYSNLGCLRDCRLETFRLPRRTTPAPYSLAADS